MQILFRDATGKLQVLQARDAAAVAALVLQKHADGWALAPENPPVVLAAASAVTGTSGVFIDPQGNTMPLSANTVPEFRVLVTKKLAKGWKYAPGSQMVAPLKNETTVALAPPAPPAPVVAPLPVPSAAEREAAIAEAQAVAAALDVNEDGVSGKAEAAAGKKPRR